VVSREQIRATVTAADPDLADVIDRCKGAVGASLVFVSVPGLELGTRPAWLDWPCVRGDEFAAADWNPRKPARNGRNQKPEEE
jgi:hypothetical protein